MSESLALFYEGICNSNFHLAEDGKLIFNAGNKLVSFAFSFDDLAQTNFVLTETITKFKQRVEELKKENKLNDKPLIESPKTILVNI